MHMLSTSTLRTFLMPLAPDVLSLPSAARLEDMRVPSTSFLLMPSTFLLPKFGTFSVQSVPL